MTIILISIVVMFSSLFIIFMLGLRRINKVFHFRIKVLDESTFDYEALTHNPYVDMVDFDTMVKKFWKPLDKPENWLK